MALSIRPFFCGLGTIGTLVGLGLTAWAAPAGPPTDPSWTAYQVTDRDVQLARRARTDVLTYLYGPRTKAVSRFNRLDPKLVHPGRRLRVPQLSAGDDYRPLPDRYEPADNQAKLALVVLDRQFIGLYEFGQLKASFPISSGKAGHRTPTGDFAVTAKSRRHRSSVYPKPYGGQPMPWAVRFHLTQFWIHQGNLFGYPASHGCVRLMRDDAVSFYNWAEFGMKVKVIRSL